MNYYEGMFIFPEDCKDDRLDEALNKVKEEIQNLGGQVDSVTRIGRRGFARPMKKKTAGQYVVMGLQIDGTKLTALHNRLNLKNDEVFRVQFVKAVPPAAPKD